MPIPFVQNQLLYRSTKILCLSTGLASIRQFVLKNVYWIQKYTELKNMEDKKFLNVILRFNVPNRKVANW
jgi:hypothetical protein